MKSNRNNPHSKTVRVPKYAKAMTREELEQAFAKTHKWFRQSAELAHDRYKSDEEYRDQLLALYSFSHLWIGKLSRYELVSTVELFKRAMAVQS